MASEPKLFTQADIAWLERETDPRDIIRILRERGLIAPEVDPLLVEAREICAQSTRCEQSRAAFRKGTWDEWSNVQVAVAALKRGMELVQDVHQLPGKTEELRGSTISKMETVADRAALTREMVREAVMRNTVLGCGGYFDDEAIHAALTEAQQ